MLKRIITAVVAFIIFLPALIFSDSMFFPVAMSICAFLGVYEMLSCLGLRERLIFSLPLYIFALAMPITMRLMPAEEFANLAVCLIGVVAVYMLGVAVFQHAKISVMDAGLACLLGIYIISAFTGIVYIRDVIPHGKYIFLLSFICAWTTDTFAYFSGRMLGKHKLIPEVSPKKTVEGAIGGIAFCVIALVVFGIIMEQFFSLEANYITLAVSGVFISIVSQLGDLIMSLVKRKYDIKDYGKIFPGHGGILDRFDSVIAVALVLTFICTYFNLLV